MKNIYKGKILLLISMIIMLGVSLVQGQKTNTTIASGYWGDDSIWDDGTGNHRAPYYGDGCNNVVIGVGTTVTINNSPGFDRYATITVNGTLQFDDGNINDGLGTNDIIIGSTGVLRPSGTANSGTYVNHGMQIGGNLVNNGTIITENGTQRIFVTMGRNDDNPSGGHIRGTVPIDFFWLAIGPGAGLSIYLETPVNVTQILDLGSGNLDNTLHNVTIKSNVLLRVTNGTFSVAPIFTDSHVTIEYDAPRTTGNELPAVIENLNSGVHDLILDKNVEVTSNLDLNSFGRIITGNNILTVDGNINGDVAVYDNFFRVIGNLARPFTAGTSKPFPIGSLSVARWVTVNVTAMTFNSGSTGTITVSQTDLPPLFTSLCPSIDCISDIRYWTITPSANINTISADVSLSWGDDDQVYDLSNITVVHGTHGGAWGLENNSGGTGGWPSGHSGWGWGYVTGTNFTSFSDFTLGNKTGGSNPLPVQINSFAASIEGTKAVLNWTTATEVNNYGFEVQRCKTAQAAQEWGKIGFVKGNGNSNSPKEYSFIDNNQPSGIVKYRLKQIDLNGKFEYSKEVEVNIAVPSILSLNQNYPNPFNPVTIITYSIPKQGLVTIKVFDVLGKEVSTIVSEVKEPGNYQATFDGSKLPSGVYIYRLHSNNFVINKKMLLIK